MSEKLPATPSPEEQSYDSDAAARLDRMRSVLMDAAVDRQRGAAYNHGSQNFDEAELRLALLGQRQEQPREHVPEVDTTQATDIMAGEASLQSPMRRVLTDAEAGWDGNDASVQPLEVSPARQVVLDDTEQARPVEPAEVPGNQEVLVTDTAPKEAYTGMSDNLRAAYRERRMNTDKRYAEWQERQRQGAEIDAQVESGQFIGEVEQYLQDQERLASDIDTLVTGVLQNESAQMQEIDTPEGPLTVEHGRVDHEVEVERVTDHEGEMIEKITIVHEGEAHAIEVATGGESGKEVTIDGELPTDGDLQSVDAVVRHISETALEDSAEGQPDRQQDTPVADAAVHEVAAQPVSTQEVGQKASKGRAAGFVGAMVRSHGARSVIEGVLGDASRDFYEKAQANNIDVSDELMGRMREVFQEYPPNSGIWNEKPNQDSALGRLAGDARRKLAAIIGEMNQ